MSHPEQQAFFQAIADANQARLGDARVLEVGSYDVNGSVRTIINSAEYVGVDLTPGPGVDVVGYGHELAYPDGAFDVTISGECFEHDPHWRDTFSNMVRMTRPGGLVVFSCASRGRLEHGTRRTDATESPGTQAEGLDYYRNLDVADFEDAPLDDWFSAHRFWRQKQQCDLYFAGVRKAREPGGYALPEDERVRAIKMVRPRGEVLLRAPLRPLSFLPESVYQPIALAYWPRALAARVALRRAAPARSVRESN